jgi:hypothetical protein
VNIVAVPIAGAKQAEMNQKLIVQVIITGNKNMVENIGRNNNLFLRRIGPDNGEVSRLKTPSQVNIIVNGKLQFGWSLDREDIANQLAEELRQAGQQFFTPNRQQMNESQIKERLERRLSLFWQSKDKEVKTTDGKLT